ncbi:MAG TPA: hypothetical protein VJZ00_23575 [Thermoanaerobaculia bacterium]|nr:hypothetical protein [Thermoanaerobaculia bacterium]
MDANQALYVVCHNGVFTIPDRTFQSLSSMVTNGFVYLRQDADTLTISTTRINGGQRRVFNGRFRAHMFRDARELAIVDLKGVVQVMAVK